MTDQTGGDQPQKTVAELLAQHGAQVDGGSRRRRRRAADDDDEVAAPPEASTGSHRRPGVSDTGSQAIIDRVNADNGMPPARAAAPRRRPEPQPPAPPVPPKPPARPVPQESQQLPRPVAPPPPARPASESRDRKSVV